MNWADHAKQALITKRQMDSIKQENADKQAKENLWIHINAILGSNTVDAAALTDLVGTARVEMSAGFAQLDVGRIIFFLKPDPATIRVEQDDHALLEYPVCFHLMGKAHMREFEIKEWADVGRLIER